MCDAEVWHKVGNEAYDRQSYAKGVSLYVQCKEASSITSLPENDTNHFARCNIMDKRDFFIMHYVDHLAHNGHYLGHFHA